MAFIMSFYESCQELEELRTIFIQLDKTNDGRLAKEEIKDGLDNVMGKIKKNKQIYE